MELGFGPISAQPISTLPATPAVAAPASPGIPSAPILIVWDYWGDLFPDPNYAWWERLSLFATLAPPPPVITFPPPLQQPWRAEYNEFDFPGLMNW